RRAPPVVRPACRADPHARLRLRSRLIRGPLPGAGRLARGPPGPGAGRTILGVSPASRRATRGPDGRPGPCLGRATGRIGPRTRSDPVEPRPLLRPRVGGGAGPHLPDPGREWAVPDGDRRSGQRLNRSLVPRLSADRATGALSDGRGGRSGPAPARSAIRAAGGSLRRGLPGHRGEPPEDPPLPVRCAPGAPARGRGPGRLRAV